MSEQNKYTQDIEVDLDLPLPSRNDQPAGVAHADLAGRHTVDALALRAHVAEVQRRDGQLG